MSEKFVRAFEANLPNIVVPSSVTSIDIEHVVKSNNKGGWIGILVVVIFLGFILFLIFDFYTKNEVENALANSSNVMAK